MKKSKEFAANFMAKLHNMKKYQGIDIMNPETYGGNKEIVHRAFMLESKIIGTETPVEIKEIDSVSTCEINNLKKVLK